MKDEIKQNTWSEKLLLSLIMYIVNHKEKGNRGFIYCTIQKSKSIDKNCHFKTMKINGINYFFT